MASDVCKSGLAIVGVDDYFAVHFVGVTDGFESLETLKKCPFVVTWFALFKLTVIFLLRALHKIIIALVEFLDQFLKILYKIVVSNLWVIITLTIS